ncbi:MAG: c-type cytochrome [Deferribacteraceae bacterium]|jgi:sulfide dehydrogenase cytochrome subunit|nr:c-type cytochrome [Deferribacteraceae bacterium]
MYRYVIAVLSLLFILSVSAWADEISFVSYCTSCHGTNGAGPGETIPYISGQSKEYLAITMTEMRDATRYATLMQTLAKGYNDEEIEALAAWFAARQWVSNTNKTDSALAANGKALSESCSSCHEESMREVPRISGQPSGYLSKAMLEYKNMLRNNDGGAAMMIGVVDMSDEDIQALAEYYSGLK